MKNLKKFCAVMLVLLMILVTMVPVSAAATYYVDVTNPNASDANPGTEALPWLTIAHGIAQLQAGDTLYVKQGTYQMASLNVTNLQGSANEQINIQAYPGDTPILYGSGVSTGCVTISGCQYITFSGFDVTNMLQGIHVTGSSNITISDVEVYNVGKEGIRIYGNSGYITVQNSSIHDTRQYNYSGEGFIVGTGSAGPLDNTHHVTIKNNFIYNTLDEAVELKEGTHDCLVDGNTIYNTNTALTAYPVIGAIHVNSHTAGVQYWGSNPNHTICNNTIHSVATSGIAVHTGCSVYNNVIYDIPENSRGICIRDLAADGYTRYIYHNTVHLPSARAIYAWEGTRDIKNNIGPAAVNNIATSDTYYVSVQSGYEDFHLVSGSDPVDAGQDVGIGTDKDGVTRPQDSGYDYGAYELSVDMDTYYADIDNPNASDANPGTEALPWLTIAYGISQLQPGDTLYVKEGTYQISSLYVTGKSGTSNEWINIQAYPGDDVVLYGVGVYTGRVKFSNCHYINFSGFEVTNFNQGIFIEGSSSNIILDNLDVHHVGQEGIHIHQNSSYITVQNSSIHDMRQWNYNGEGFYIGTGSGGSLDNTHHITVKNNVIYNTTDEAIELKPGTHDCVVDGNTVYNACTNLTAYYTIGAISVNPHTSGNQFWGENPNHIICNNIVHSTATSGIELRTGCKAYNNVIYDIPLTNAKGIVIRDLAGDGYTRNVYHNTIHLASNKAIYVYEGTADIRNNIGPATANNIAADDSYFVSVQSGQEDFHLVSGSDPIDAGQDVGISVDRDGISRPQDSGYDYGAYEYAE